MCTTEGINRCVGPMRFGQMGSIAIGTGVPTQLQGGGAYWDDTSDGGRAEVHLRWRSP